MITIKITGLKELNEKIRKFEGKNPPDRVCKELAKMTVQTMKSRAPYWHGSLQKSIQSRKTKQGYNIHMNFYGRFLEFGHIISPGSQPTLLRTWAMDKFGAEEGMEWFLAVGKYGHYVRAQPFVQPSIDSVMKGFDNTASFEIKNCLKEAGFHE